MTGVRRKGKEEALPWRISPRLRSTCPVTGLAVQSRKRSRDPTPRSWGPNWALWALKTEAKREEWYLPQPGWESLV